MDIGNKIIPIEDIYLYAEAKRRLDKYNIIYSKEKLLTNQELCRDIISLLDLDKNNNNPL